MYLSFIKEQQDILTRQLENLEELQERLEGGAEDIIEQLRNDMRDMIHETISEAFDECGIEDNYFDEKRQETEDAMVEYISGNF